MDDVSVFRSVVEPSLERIPLLEILHDERANGVTYLVSHMICRNVMTNFDSKLSRHISATKGIGFPSVSIKARFCEKSSSGATRGKWRKLAPGYFPSVPHALRSVAVRALNDGDRGVVTIFEGAARDFGGVGSKRELTRGDVASLTAALDLAGCVGEAEFVEITGDFDMITIQPLGAGLQPLTADLLRGTVSAPESPSTGRMRFEGALHDFINGAVEQRAARLYMAEARRSLAKTKEDAVLNFRAAAEDRILEVNRALNGKPLTDFRLEVVRGLISRLKVGLGDNLHGLSEDAQITAFEWADTIYSAMVSHERQALGISELRR
jgi:hypothetical protein